MNRHVVIRLSGRPEMERGTWIVTPRVVETGWFEIFTGRGRQELCRPTGHYEGDHEVWVPEGQLENWPPHEQRLINILRDEGDIER